MKFEYCVRSFTFYIIKTHIIMESRYRKAYDGYCKEYNKKNLGGYGDQDWPDSYDTFLNERIQAEISYGKTAEKETDAYIKIANQKETEEYIKIANQMKKHEHTQKYDNTQNNQTGSYIKQFATGIVIGTVAAGFFNKVFVN